MITNTHSVGVVRDAVIEWRIKSGPTRRVGLLVVAAGRRRDLRRRAQRHQRLPREGAPRLRGARRRHGRPGRRGQRRRRHRHDRLRLQGRHRHGVAGRRRPAAARYTVGVLVQANFGRRAAADDRRGAGRPRDPGRRRRRRPTAWSTTRCAATWARSSSSSAPTRRCCRISSSAWPGAPPSAWPAPAGVSGNGSGDIFIAFSTANPERLQGRAASPRCRWSRTSEISPIFDATAWATEEAIVNAMVAAETMIGADGRRVERLPHDRLREALKKYNRLAPP